MSTDPQSAGDRLKNNPNLVRCPSCSAVMSKKATACPKCSWSAQSANSQGSVPGAESNDLANLDLQNLGLPSFSSVQPIPISQPSPLHAQAPTAAQKQLAKARSEMRSNDESESRKRWLWIIAPWTTENTTHKYGNLQRFNLIYASVAKIGFVITSILIVLCVLFFGARLPIAIVLGDAMQNEPFLERFFYAMSMMIAVVVTAFFALVLAHLTYIFTMALTDYFRCLMDTEENTRKR